MRFHSFVHETFFLSYHKTCLVESHYEHDTINIIFAKVSQREHANVSNKVYILQRSICMVDRE